MNSCNFVGRLGSEPELRRTNDGTAVCSFSLAVKRPMVKDTTDWIYFVAWRQSAEYLCQYAHKGDVVAATGSIQPRKWTDKNGNERKAFEVVTTGVELLSSKKTSESHNAAPAQQNAPTGGYGTPQYPNQMPPQYNQQGFGGYQQPAFQGQMYQPPQQFAPIEGDDAKLPF